MLRTGKTWTVTDMSRWRVEISANNSARRPPAQRQNKTINQTDNQYLSMWSVTDLWVLQDGLLLNVYTYKIDLHYFIWKKNLIIYKWPFLYPLTNVISPPKSVECNLWAGPLAADPMAKAVCLQSIRSIQWFHVILILGVIFSCRGAWTGWRFLGCLTCLSEKAIWMKTCWFSKSLEKKQQTE